jgi:hypothetical protein
MSIKEHGDQFGKVPDHIFGHLEQIEGFHRDMSPTLSGQQKKQK